MFCFKSCLEAFGIISFSFGLLVLSVRVNEFGLANNSVSHFSSINSTFSSFNVNSNIISLGRASLITLVKADICHLTLLCHTQSHCPPWLSSLCSSIPEIILVLIYCLSPPARMTSHEKRDVVSLFTVSWKQCSAQSKYLMNSLEWIQPCNIERNF